MRILAVDISALFRRFWEVTKGNELADAMPHTLGAIAKHRDGCDRIAICCDSGLSFRRLLWDTYKANRTDPGEAYREQLRRVLEQLRKDGHSIFKAPEYVPTGITAQLGAKHFAEADDVIGSLCAWAVGQGHAVRILSSDKDLMQLIDDERGIDLIKIDKGTIANEAYLGEKLGISPQKLPLFLALAGDDSDNFKPYPGMGDKRAAALIRAFAPSPQEGIEAIFSSLHDAEAILTAPLAKRMMEAGPDAARRALRVSTIVRDLAIDFGPILAEPIAAPLTDAGKQEAPTRPETRVEDRPQPLQPAQSTPERPAASVAAQPESAALVRTQPSSGYSLAPFLLEPNTPKGAWWLAQQIHESRLFQKKIGNAAAAYMILIEGRALGMPAIVALKNAYVVHGQVAWSARVLRGLCMKHTDCEYFEITESTPMAAAARWKRRGRAEQTLRITIEEAQLRGFVKEPGRNRRGEDTEGNKWNTDPKVMLVAAVEREGARLGFPEVVAGLYTPDEIREDGTVIEAEYTEAA